MEQYKKARQRAVTPGPSLEHDRYHRFRFRGWAARHLKYWEIHSTPIMPSQKWNCTICKREMDQLSKDQHLRGGKHRLKAAALSNVGQGDWKCKICDRQMAQASRESHLRGKTHLKKAAKAAKRAPVIQPSQSISNGSMWTCEVCDRHMNAGSRAQHLRGKDHKRKVSSSKAKAVVPAATVPEKWTCEPCGRQMDTSTREDHLRGKRHKAAIAQSGTAQDRVDAINTAAIDEPQEEDENEEFEGDKNGFTVEGGLDFKIVDLASATRGITVQVSIKAKATFRAEIIGCILASSRAERTYSPFTFTFVGQNRTVSPSSSVQLKVNMTTEHYGRAEDRLEVTLDSPQLRSQFVLARRLRVHVGDQSTQNDLQPRIPYTPRDRSTPRQPEIEIIPGEREPSPKAFPYTRALPRARIPGPLANDLSSGSTREIVDRMRMVYLPPVFDSQGYGKHFKHLIWAEEYQMELDMEHFDMHNAQLEKRNKSYYLNVPGLAEKRPSVLVGDTILVQPHGSPQGLWFEGCVHTVHQLEVGMHLNKKFAPKPSDRLHIRFKLNRSSLRRQHQALDWPSVEGRILFPEPEHLGPGEIPEVISRSLFNPAIANNPRQLQAISSIVRAPAGSVPFVLFGPPGTGKTVTLVESIRQILDANPKARILACAPSNSAADLIALRLRELGPDVLFRAYAQSRFYEQVPDELRAFTYRNPTGKFSVRGVDEVKRFRVVVTTCISASIVSGIGIDRGHYSHVFVDEAGQATEPEVMASVKMMADERTNVILCGDPKQLGPVIRSSVARRLGLGISFIERLMGLEIYDEVGGHGISVVKLTKNYRSHNAILKFPNEHFYGGDLEPCADPAIANLYLNSSHVVSRKFPVVFHSVFGKDDREASSPSYFNLDEVTVVKSILEKLKKDASIPLRDDDIGVIAPYRAQVLKLRAAFRSLNAEVKVGSVEEFQGQERKVIIVTTVRSSREFVDYDLRHTLGFVANPRRFNVAVTRARSLLVIVGDPNVLSLDPLWRSFMNYVYENGGWRGPGPAWDTTEPVDFNGGYDVAIRDQARAEMEAFSMMMGNSNLDGNADVGGDVNVDQPWAEMN